MPGKCLENFSESLSKPINYKLISSAFGMAWRKVVLTFTPWPSIIRFLPSYIDQIKGILIYVRKLTHLKYFES